MDFSLIFGNGLKKETKRIINDYPEMINYINKDFLKIIKEQELRDRIYAIYKYNPELISNFVTLYNKNSKLALLSLDATEPIFDNKLESILKNEKLYLNLVENGYNLKDLFNGYESATTQIEKIINICKVHEELFFEIFNLDKNNYMTIFNLNLHTNFDKTFIINNYDEIKNIFKRGTSEISYKLLDILYSNENCYKYIKEMDISQYEKMDKDIWTILHINNYSLELVKFINENNLYSVSLLLGHANKLIKNNEIEKGMNIIYTCKDFYKTENNMVEYKRTINRLYTLSNTIDFYNYIDNELEPGIKNVMKLLIEIDKLNSIEDIDKCISRYNINPNPIKFNLSLVRYQQQDLRKKTFSPDIKQGYQTEDGIIIIDDSICDLTRFKMLAHVVSERKESPNGEIAMDLLDNPNIWTDTSIKGADLLSCSLLSQNDLQIWGDYGRVVLGFSDLDNPYISKIETCDGMTSMYGENVDKSQEFQFYQELLASGLTDDVRFDKLGVNHNEIAIGRYMNGSKITPSYIISTKNFDDVHKNVPINERTKMWAKHFNIPIVVLDGLKIKERAFNELQQLIGDLKNGNITQTLFYEIILRCRTIENVTSKLMNLDEIINMIFDVALSNPTEKNINELNCIINFYPLLEMIKNDKTNFKENSDELINLREQKLKVKIEQINKIVLTQQTQEEVIIGKEMGFVSLNYLTYEIVISLVVLLIIILLNTI